jgi:hypothetical protein
MRRDASTWRMRLGAWWWVRGRTFVIFDATRPGLVVAADRDPVAAVVLHSSIRDIGCYYC